MKETKCAVKGVANNREKKGALAGLLGMGLNVILGVAKLVVGLLSGSAAIISDAANNFSDAGNSMVTVSSFLLGGRKADKDHPYGHGRYEYIASLLIGAIIVVVGFQFALSSIDKIINPATVKLSLITIIVMSVSIAVKLFMAFFYRIKAKTLNSGTLKAASADSFFDCLVTFAVIIGTVLTLVLPAWIDGAVALLVSGVIIFGGIKVILDTVNRLLGKADRELSAKIKTLILTEPLVLGTHDLRVHDYGPSRVLASVHAEFDRCVNIMEAHEVIDGLEHKVFNSLGVELVVHCDPIDACDVTANRIRHAIKDIIRVFDGSSVHDLVIDSEHNTVTFHLKIRDRDIKKQRENITCILTEAINCVLENYAVEIEYDVIFD